MTLAVPAVDIVAAALLGGEIAVMVEAVAVTAARLAVRIWSSDGPVMAGAKATTRIIIPSDLGPGRDASISASLI
jgi:hypothetical protein